MTLEEYNIYCQTNKNDRIRYDIEEEVSVKEFNDQLSRQSISSKNSEIVNPNYLHPSRKTSSKFAQRRPQTGFKDKSRIIGNIDNVRLLQNTIHEKKVNFNAFKTNSSIHSNIRRNSSRSGIGLSRIKPINPALKSISRKKGIRPQTAKNFYTQNIQKIRETKEKNRVHIEKEKYIKEAVIKYTDIEKPSNCIYSLTIVIENQNLDVESQPSLRIRPTSAFKSPTAISAFDKFNRDIIDHKIPMESVKRLKPKSLHISKRIQSAKRKVSPKKPTSRTRITSATHKHLPTNNFMKDGIINVKIPLGTNKL